MANPFANSGLNQFGGESKYLPSGNEGGGLGTVAGLYLANQLGLIDLKNMSDKDKTSMQKNGVLSSIVGNKLMTPAGSVPAPQQNMPIAPVQIGGPMNQQLPQGTPLPPLSSVESNDTVDAGLDHELIDSSLPNFAALFGARNT